ncbi:MAG: hypothetical protein DRJ42_20370 [Deltaproteobacteria bacterium]|nr:MAG: hypothetical protein DRJ42_20370 [Deltaproteobacteria bacterium]
MKPSTPTLSSLLLALIGTMAVSACAAESDVGRATLDNSNGKDDGVSLRQRLTESAPSSGLDIRCDGSFGCNGTVTIEVIAPDACELLGNPAQCGVDAIDPQSVEIATVTIYSFGEGERVLPFVVETGDGSFFSTYVSVAFAVGPGDTVSIDIVKSAMVPDLELVTFADWTDSEAPDAGELGRYLDTVAGLTYQELATMYSGYRAYDIEFEQPLDHTDPNAGTFIQRAVLHHLDKSAPMVLYTSGYGLFVDDYLSEMPEAGGMNQLSTEQRFFGDSLPPGPTTEDWDHVTIAQAAADHHRFVEALEPFYDGSWISTGHSKGGMTSIFHRRFYPDDIDATVAYVAPISFAPADPRYASFLDHIGSDDCRERLRGVQKLYLERLDELEALAMPEVEMYGYTYEYAGGLRRALEDGIVWMEWGFWQNSGLESCEQLPTRSSLETASAEDVWQSMLGRVGYGQSDQSLAAAGSSGTYHYQAARELGYQSCARGHLEALLTTDPVPWWVPHGLAPDHDPSAMPDIQEWVLSEGSQIIFIYGEHDPWTGGAYEVPDVDDVLRVTAPGANHGAMIRTLLPDDRGQVLDAIESWTGTRPALDDDAPVVGPLLPPRLMLGI